MKLETTESQRENALIKKSLRYSILDGSFHAAMLGFGESFLSAFAVFLKANNIHLALLGSLPILVGSLSPLMSNAFLRRMKSRKSLVASAAFFQAIMFIPLSLVFFFGDWSVILLIILVCVYWVFGMIHRSQALPGKSSVLSISLKKHGSGIMDDLSYISVS